MIQRSLAMLSVQSFLTQILRNLTTLMSFAQVLRQASWLVSHLLALPTLTHLITLKSCLMSSTVNSVVMNLQIRSLQTQSQQISCSGLTAQRALLILRSLARLLAQYQRQTFQIMSIARSIQCVVICQILQHVLMLLKSQLLQLDCRSFLLTSETFSLRFTQQILTTVQQHLLTSFSLLVSNHLLQQMQHGRRWLVLKTHTVGYMEISVSSRSNRQSFSVQQTKAQRLLQSRSMLFVKLQRVRHQRMLKRLSTQYAATIEQSMLHAQLLRSQLHL